MPYETAIHTVDIEKLVYHSYGLGRINNYTVLVPDTLPGDRIEMKLTERKKNHGIGQCLNRLTQSPYRTPARCAHFPSCGGCQWADVSYTDQLKLKMDILFDSAKQFYPEAQALIQPITPAPEQYHYRNKMDYAFGQDDTGLFIGLKRRGHFDQPIRINECLLQSELSNQIRQFSAQFFQTANATVWSYSAKTGLLKYFICRHSKTTDSYVINVVITEPNIALIQAFAEAIKKAFPQIQGVVVSINTQTQGDTIKAENVTLINGHATLIETINGLSFEISPLSFFQTNTLQAQTLYQTIKTLAKPQKNEQVLDLYCGTGTIGLSLASEANTIFGIEEVPDAIKNAQKNATLNHLTNVQFHCGRVRSVLKLHHFSADVIITDPPRSGMCPKAIERMTRLNAPKIIYVSCNPVNMMRDLKQITQSGYKIEVIQPVDMFPNTYHIECVVKLIKA